MSLTEVIIQHVNTLPEPARAEVLDFVKYLESKKSKPHQMQENVDWSTFSLSSAMRGMEDEDSAYTLDDLKELFK